MRKLRHRRRTGEAGQGTVEFVFISVSLAFVMVFVWQMAWVACQKWYFNYTAAYAARAWSVQPKALYSTQEILYKVQSAAFLRSASLVKMPLVKIVTAEDANVSSGEADDLDRFGTGSLPNGIRYKGLALYFKYFQPETIRSAGFETKVLASPAVVFETYIPIDHEDTWGVEDPGRYDNDCSYPCSDNIR